MSKKDLVSAAPASPVPTVADAVVADPAPRLPMPEPPDGWPADEFTGQAGQFVRDPFTGVRSRAPVAAE